MSREKFIKTKKENGGRKERIEKKRGRKTRGKEVKEVSEINLSMGVRRRLL
jgi:hypothetical protein